jgi:3'(2'), 5'-bisphosphate nucleotidase
MSPTTGTYRVRLIGDYGSVRQQFTNTTHVSQNIWNRRFAIAHSPEISLEHFLAASLVSAKRAGDAILAVYHSAFDVELKDDRSPLTLADKRAHEIIAGDLAAGPMKNSSSLPLLSEEGKHIPYEMRGQWNDYWLIDPLDGTKEFIKRNGEFTVNIALISGKRPVLGVIYAPERGTLYFAARKIGSYRLDDVTIVHDLDAKGGFDERGAGEDALRAIIGKSRKLKSNIIRSEPSTITVVGSRSHGGEEMDDFLNRLKNRFKRVNMASAGSSLKLCMVAEGSADLYIRHGPTMEWDIAAGQIIVEEAGGAVVNLTSALPLEYNKENLLNPAFLVARRDPKEIMDLLG